MDPLVDRTVSPKSHLRHSRINGRFYPFWELLVYLQTLQIDYIIALFMIMHKKHISFRPFIGRIPAVNVQTIIQNSGRQSLVSP